MSNTFFQGCQKICRGDSYPLRPPPLATGMTARQNRRRRRIQTYFRDDEFRIFGRVELQLGRDVGERYSRITGRNASHARLDHIVTHAQDQSVVAVAFERFAELFEDVVESAQITGAHRCSSRRNKRTCWWDDPKAEGCGFEPAHCYSTCSGSRGVTRLDGARGKKQVRCPHVRTWGLSEANVLFWRKCLWHCWDFSAPPAVIRLPGIVLPCPPSLRPCLTVIRSLQ